jgi:hypothetical protein
MVDLTLEVPEALARLPAAERDRLIRAGLHEATRARIRQLTSEIARVKDDVAHFERRYGMSLSQFDEEVLCQNNSHQVHDDYNDWFYAQTVLEEKKALLSDLTSLDLV